MTTVSLAPSTISVQSKIRPQTSTARIGLATLSKSAVFAWSALYAAYALRATIDAGPHHLHELVFVLGAITLVAVCAWVMPFAGALLMGSAGTAVWVFLDTTPANAWLAGAACLAMGLTMSRWMTERAARDV